MKHIGIYMRVSTRAQDTASQEPDLHRWANAQGEPVVFYSDTFTGRVMSRPGMDRLMADVRAGKVSRIACWRLDRLGRSARGLAALFEELQALNVGLVSLRDSLDLGTAAGRLMAHVLASVGQYETEIRHERVVAGQAAARAKGKRWGGGRKGRRTSLSASPEQVELILRLRGERVPVTRIAKAVRLSRKTIYQYIGQPA